MNRRIRMFPLRPILPLLIVLAGCAGNHAVGVGGPRVDQSKLSHVEILHYQTAMQAVQTMRSQWLRARSPGDLISGAGNVRVYRDGFDVGGVEALKTMSTVEIDYIRFYNGIQASWRWGLGHQDGVIFVSSESGIGPGGPP